MEGHKILTRQGYVLSKKVLSKKELELLKNTLEVKPQVHSEFADNVESFKIYVENDDMICVPRYYGIKKFGKPNKIIPMNTAKVNTKFNGELRDLQKPIVNTCLKKIKKNGGGMISIPCGAGKCFAKGTEIMMFNGDIKKVEDIVISDKLMGDDGNERNVLSLAQGDEMMYCIKGSIMNDKINYTVNESHILSLKNIKTNEIIDISVKDYLQLPNEQKILLKGYRVKLNFSNCIANCNVDNCKDPYLYGCNLVKYHSISQNYKCGSIETRLNVLAGIIDICGNLIEDHYEIDCKNFNKTIIDDIIFISRSLGLVIDCIGCIVNIYGNMSMIPTKLSNNTNNNTNNDTNINLTYDITIEKCKVDKYYGFEIDGNRRFLLKDFTVTHNTVCGIYLHCQLKLKTLIVVHKTFLQDQWYERIKQFSNARIGMIRQKKVDIEDKDIVVGMLQSISMIDYDPEIFKDFGLVIFDECFIRRERVLTNNGPIRIGQLYDMWKEGKELPLIKSFNEKTKEFEYKRLTYAWKKESSKLVQVKIGKRSIICTPKHKYLTLNGYKQANQLKSNDILLGISDGNLQENVFARGLNDDQLQIVLGSFLGDGNIDILPSGRYRLRETHGLDQKEYCRWKASMFDVDIECIKKNGYAEKPAVRFATQVFDFQENFPKSKTNCPQWIIDKIDWRAIAIWIMDDGSLNDKSPRITISTCSFNEDSQKRLVNKLKSLNVPSLYYKDKKGYYYIGINEEGTKKLMSKIYPYIHQSMTRKLSTKSLTEYLEDLQRDHSKENSYNYVYNIPNNVRVEDKIYYGIYDKKKVKYLYKKCLKCNENKFHSVHSIYNEKEYWKCTNCTNVKKKYIYDINSSYKYEWNADFLQYRTCKITSVRKQKITKRYKYVYDIEVEDNHNFIIGSRSSKENGPIVHNCHHLGARIFSKAMQKTGGHYTIGLSATPNRSDGLTKVIKWYLGDIMYKMDRKGDKNVVVKFFNYESNDKLFVEKKMWMKGKIRPSIPKMLSNLGKIKGRNKLLVDIINNLRNKDDRKILILSARIAHLEILKEEIDKILEQDVKDGKLEEEEITTAYYIGRCKRYELVESAKADIIFASYSMAEEGLDIDKLNTLILASPKKNIIQSIGRILRKPIKEGDINPLIIDVVDQLSSFERWGQTRRKYYNKNKYTTEFYQCWNDKCISLREYLILNKVIKEENEDVDIRKEFVIFKYGIVEWEFMEDLMSEEDDSEEERKYNYDPDLNKILDVNLDFME